MDNERKGMRGEEDERKGRRRHKGRKLREVRGIGGEEREGG